MLRTTLGERVLIPNSQVARSRVRLLGEGDQAVAVPLRLGVAYEAPPHAVKEVLARVAADLPRVLAHPAPQVLAREFADSAVTYECRLWTREPWRAADLADAFYTSAHAALKRAGMEIPFPQRSVHMVAASRAEADPLGMARAALARCALFAGLPGGAIAALAGSSHWQEYVAGEAVVREGEVSRALYVIAGGEAAVERGGTEVARVGAGEVFGEMAFLSGRRAPPRCAPSARSRWSRSTAARSRPCSPNTGSWPRSSRNGWPRGSRTWRPRRRWRAAGGGRKGLAAFLRERLLRLVAG